MVKRPLIAKKPTTNNNSVPSADAWVDGGGVDPEIQTTAPDQTDRSAPDAAVQPEEKEKPFPHRLSFDMSREQYKRLKFASYDSECSMNEILREAIDRWLEAANY